MSVIDRLKQVVSGAVVPSQKKSPDPKDLPEKNAGDGLTSLLVWSAPRINRTLLICHEPGREGNNPMNLVNVQVRNNENFLRGMELRARRIQDKRYILEGPLPRRRGKW